MRTGYLGSLSERDRAGIRERRAFEQAEAERQRLAEDQVEYEKYRSAIEDEQRYVPPAHQMAPLDFETWRSYAPQDEPDPILRGQIAANGALLSKVRRDEAAEVKSGKADPAFQIPESAKGLRMSVEAAKEFARKQGELFVEHNPEYFPSGANVAVISKYLGEQGITIPNEECLRVAWLRLRELGMIEERPIQPEPEPLGADKELKEQKRHDYHRKIVVIDPRTNEGLTQYQVDRLSADEYKRLMIGEFKTPRLTDVIKPAWFK